VKKSGAGDVLTVDPLRPLLPVCTAPGRRATSRLEAASLLNVRAPLLALALASLGASGPSRALPKPAQQQVRAERPLSWRPALPPPEERKDERDGDEAERAREREQGPEHDDAMERRRARYAEEAESPADPQARAGWLTEARRERQRLGLSVTGAAKLFSPAQGAALRVPGNTWLNAGPTRSDYSFNDVTYNDIDSGRIRTIVPHPSDPGILYVATSSGGVWKTWDGGLGWTPITDDVGSTSNGALAMDPGSPEVLYLGLGDPYDVAQPGMLSSNDGGQTWSEPVFLRGTYSDFSGVPKPTLATQTRDLAVDPLNSLHLLAATDYGLFQSNDAGRTWAMSTPPGIASFAEVWSIAWLGGQTWMVVGQNLDTRVTDSAGNLIEGALLLWKSTDAGQTWTNLSGKLPAPTSSMGRGTLAVAPLGRGTPQARVFLLVGAASGAATYDVYRTDDAGSSWKALGVNGGRQPKNPARLADHVNDLDILGQQAFYNQSVLVDPDDPDIVLIGGQLGLIRSLDAGATWEVVGDWLPAGTSLGLPYIHADHHILTVSFAGGQKRFFAGTDGGVFTSTDLTSATPTRVHFSDALNTGLVTHLAYSVACARPEWPSALQGFLMGGLQDNGTRLRSLGSPGGPGTFDQVFGGDGFGVATGRETDALGQHPALLVTTTYQGSYWSSSDGGKNFFKFGSTVPGVPFHTRVVAESAAADPVTFLTISNPTTSTAGVVWRSSGYADWTSINGTIRAGDGTPIGTFQSPAAAGVIGINNVATHPTAAGVYGIAAGSGVVFVTNDGGGNWFQSGLLGTNPSNTNRWIGRVASVAFDPTDPTGTRLWAGAGGVSIFDTSKPSTDPGVDVTPEFGHLFYSADRGRTWQARPGAAGHRLPNVPIRAVQVDPSDPATIYVGTILGLYRSVDSGATFDRFGSGLPMVEVTDLCISPATAQSQGSIKVSTYGRGFWELDLGPGGGPSGARGHGDLDFNQRLDAFDLLDLVSAMGNTWQTDGYRPEADLTGATNRIDDDDLAAFLQSAGGAP
jgi:hypothetical protein